MASAFLVSVLRGQRLIDRRFWGGARTACMSHGTGPFGMNVSGMLNDEGSKGVLFAPSRLLAMAVLASNRRTVGKRGQPKRALGLASAVWTLLRLDARRS